MAPQPDRTRYRRRLDNMLKSPPIFGGDPASSIESQAHWAKYACVLTSGYIEQAVKEILLSYSSLKASPAISRYVEKTWPSSKNMNVNAISDILEKFDLGWSEKFGKWVEESDERKATINNLIAWRNGIAHGKEANTTGVTVNSVKNGFSCACQMVDFLENLTTN